MAYTFTETLIVVLIMLLFAKEIFGEWVRQKLGIGGGEKKETGFTAEFVGYLKATLENIMDRMGRFELRLTKHLDDEENQRKDDMREIHDEIRELREIINELSKHARP